MAPTFPPNGLKTLKIEIFGLRFISEYSSKFFNFSKYFSFFLKLSTFFIFFKNSFKNHFYILKKIFVEAKSLMFFKKNETIFTIRNSPLYLFGMHTIIMRSNAVRTFDHATHWEKTREKYGMSLQLSAVLVSKSVSPKVCAKLLKNPTKTSVRILNADMYVLYTPIVVLFCILLCWLMAMFKKLVRKPMAPINMQE